MNIIGADEILGLEEWKLFDIVCQACGHHLVMRNIPQMCVKCGSLLIGYDTSDRDGDDQMSEDCHDSNNKHVRDWAPQRAISDKSFAQVERLLSEIKHGDVMGDAALAEQLRAIDLTLKSLLRKNTLCDCNCEKCLAGDCEDCSDPECVDPWGWLSVLSCKLRIWQRPLPNQPANGSRYRRGNQGV
jgi:hypothetical protein